MEYERLKRNDLFSTIKRNAISNDTVTVLVHNVKSLQFNLVSFARKVFYLLLYFFHMRLKKVFTNLNGDLISGTQNLKFYTGIKSREFCELTIFLIIFKA